MYAMSSDLPFSIYLSIDREGGTRQIHTSHSYTSTHPNQSTLDPTHFSNKACKEGQSLSQHGRTTRPSITACTIVLAIATRIAYPVTPKESHLFSAVCRRSTSRGLQQKTISRIMNPTRSNNQPIHHTCTDGRFGKDKHTSRRKCKPGNSRRIPRHRRTRCRPENVGRPQSVARAQWSPAADAEMDRQDRGRECERGRDDFFSENKMTVLGMAAGRREKTQGGKTEGSATFMYRVGCRR